VTRRPGGDRRGFTLLEMIIAIGLLLFIGLTVSAMLASAVKMWRSGRRRALVVDRANAVFATLQDDFRSIFLGYPLRRGRTVWPRFYCDFHPRYLTQRLILVRTLPIEGDYLAQQAGSYLKPEGDEHIDGRDDAYEAVHGKLLPTSGLMEVAYFHKRDLKSRSDDGFSLWRAVNSPPGVNSLFALSADWGETGGSGSGGSGPRFERMADGVLLFAFQFWSTHTNTWDDSEPPLFEPEKGKKSGPLLWWDSARAADSPFESDPVKGEYRLDRGGRSLADTHDDTLPRAVRVILVMAEDGDGRVARLERRLEPDSRRMTVDDGFAIPYGIRYLMVGEEWVEVEKVDGNVIRLKGRGLFGTGARDHRPRTAVRAGTTFVRIFRMPAVMDDWTRPDETPR